jgi:hypothetical protein
MAHVSVSIDDAHLGSLTSVVRELQARGLHVEQVLDVLGVVTGSVDDEASRLALRAVPGVASVDGSLRYQLPPPQADVQ